MQVPQAFEELHQIALDLWFRELDSRILQQPG